MTASRHTRAEIASQPGCWVRAVEMAAGPAPGLPAPGTAVLVIGCGTSLYVGQAYAALREEAGQGRTDALPASEVTAGLLARRGYDAVLAISRSGTTTEVLATLGDLPPGTPALAVTAVADSPIARAVPSPVVLDFADEQSVVQTRFATSAVALLRQHAGAEMAPIVADGRRALTAGLPPRLPPAAAPHVVFLARGWAVGLTAEAALKCREAAGAHSEAYPTLEYRHGPISVAGPQTLVWALTPLDAGLRADITATGATLEQGLLDPLAELVRVQRWAVAAADAAGLDADLPRHLTRSVVLAGRRP